MLKGIQNFSKNNSSYLFVHLVSTLTILYGDKTWDLAQGSQVHYHWNMAPAPFIFLFFLAFIYCVLIW